jgi:hypothetical protein
MARTSHDPGLSRYRSRLRFFRKGRPGGYGAGVSDLLQPVGCVLDGVDVDEGDVGVAYPCGLAHETCPGWVDPAALFPVDLI